jgi:hypothetical protein
MHKFACGSLLVPLLQFHCIPSLSLDLTELLTVILSNFLFLFYSNHAKDQGFSIVLDMRGSTWLAIKPVLKSLQVFFHELLLNVLYNFDIVLFKFVTVVNISTRLVAQCIVFYIKLSYRNACILKAHTHSKSGGSI